MAQPPEKVAFLVGSQKREYKVLKGVAGAPSVDLSSFTAETGFTVLDHGFVNTASTTSGITFINGDEGVLRYRGYAIDDVAQNSTFLEVAWLLIYGELPSASELEEFDHRLCHHTLLHEDL